MGVEIVMGPLKKKKNKTKKERKSKVTFRV